MADNVLTDGLLQPIDIINFWYSEPMRSHWFSSSNEIDNEIKQRFEGSWERAQTEEYDSWLWTPDGCLALVIILDQFPLNMYRGDAKSFSTEHQAIEVSKHAIEKGFDTEISEERVSFLYLPLMHSENLADQKECIRLFAQREIQANLNFAHHHHDIVARFGRFPHRNAILGRVSTKEELEYLSSDEAFKG